MHNIAKPALAYFAPVFAVAFLLGALRVTFIAPATGALLAVALEIPLVLGLSWWIAGRLLRRWPLSFRDRLFMGTLAYAFLMLAELATARAFGQSAAELGKAMTTAPGLLGLAGQIGFGLLPVARS